MRQQAIAPFMFIILLCLAVGSKSLVSKEDPYCNLNGMLACLASKGTDTGMLRRGQGVGELLLFQFICLP
ncbi:hypothetical protein M569_15660 [Genlisea aurea]|uniref:Uncharacterized protein n=1 Tax=Genlisea aurea TaxID=192259 RepID=S8BX01_9LAMI|nr:hypothetical protein M569_15660 [Genlisea aurea]